MLKPFKAILASLAIATSLGVSAETIEDDYVPNQDERYPVEPFHQNVLIDNFDYVLGKSGIDQPTCLTAFMASVYDKAYVKKQGASIYDVRKSQLGAAYALGKEPKRPVVVSSVFYPIVNRYQLRCDLTHLR